MEQDKKYQILIVEDEEPIRQFIKINLERNNFYVHEAATGEKALEKMDENLIDIVILDIMLPGIDGFGVCEVLRNRYPKVGIIILTAKSQDTDKITGLEYGTDDYMIKPFNPLELILRIKSLLRRMETISDGSRQVIKLGPFKIDSYSKKIYKNDCEIELTPTEYLILKTFIKNSNKALSRDLILNEVWGYNFVGDAKIVDVNIRRLRTKIEDNPQKPKFIETIWGTGYRWNKQ